MVRGEHDMIRFLRSGATLPADREDCRVPHWPAASRSGRANPRSPSVRTWRITRAGLDDESDANSRRVRNEPATGWNIAQASAERSDARATEQNPRHATTSALSEQRDALPYCSDRQRQDSCQCGHLTRASQVTRLRRPSFHAHADADRETFVVHCRWDENVSGLKTGVRLGATPTTV